MYKKNFLFCKHDGKFMIIYFLSLKLYLRYSITKKRAQSLEDHRSNNGPYNSLEDLLQVKGINNKCLYKFYKSIICGKKKNPRKITQGLILTPKTFNQKVQEIKFNFQTEKYCFINY